MRFVESVFVKPILEFSNSRCLRDKKRIRDRQPSVTEFTITLSFQDSMAVTLLGDITNMDKRRVQDELVEVDTRIQENFTERLDKLFS